MNFTTLMARDGHEFQAYLAAPAGSPRGAVVVLQEIFGVNRHIRAVADQYASAGYTAIAPALFDRIRRGIELGYTRETIQEGIGYMLQITPAQFLADVGAAVAAVRHSGKCGVVGFCWGGTVTYRAACDLPIACAVSYYGGSIVRHLEHHPKVPVMYHFGEEDAHIPLADIELIRATDPGGVFHLYPADHGFNCTERASYHAPSAGLAFERSLSHFAEYLT